MTKVVLASGSTARAALLRGAGIDLLVEPVRVDEDSVREACRADGLDAAATAEALALIKAQRGSRQHPDALVIGADQMLEAGGAWLDKPLTRDRLRQQLCELRGTTHRLISAVVVVRNGQVLWHTIDDALMIMRAFSDNFLNDYVDAVDDGVLHAVGGYHLEGRGAQLFSRVEGDYFTVLGLPLLPLLGFLREHGIIGT